jgi:hypothetical protein
VSAVACWFLTSCAADFNAQTNQQYQAGVGTTDRSSSVYVLNALVVANDQGEGTLVGSLINQSTKADGLRAVTTSDLNGKPITTTDLAAPIALPSQIAVKLQTDGAVQMSGPNLTLGDFVKVTLSFEQAAPIVVQIPVVPGGDDTIYTGIPIGPMTSATSTPPSSATTSSP